MAWTISTYAGTRATGQPSNWRTAMFELCRAVNEREAAIAETKTTWYKADGTTTADITMADLANIQFTGANNYAIQNLQDIQSAIVSLIGTGLFTTARGGDTVYNLAAVEAAIDTDLQTDPIRANEARFWQAQQDALDLLIYYKLTIPEGGGPCSTTHSNLASTYGSFQAAWDDMSSQPPSNYPLSFYIGGSSVSNQYGLVWVTRAGEYGIQTGACSSGTLYYDTTGYDGVVVSSEGQIVTGATYTTGPAWTPTFGPQTLAATPISQTPELSLSLGTLNSVSCSITQPAVCPERLVLGVPAQWIARASCSSVIFKVDLSSILTDQA